MLEIVGVLSRFHRWAFEPESLQNTIAFKRRHDLREDELEARCGLLAVLPCTVTNGRFTLEESGTLSAVTEILDVDAETPIDLAAWPIAEPHKMATALGFGAMLGAAQIVNPGSWFARRALPVHRNGLAWLRSGCDGIVILDCARALPLIAQKLGPLQCTDAAHAKEFAEHFFRPVIAAKDILYLSHSRKVAA